METSRTVLFCNFSDEPFTWTLNKVPRTFQPKEKVYMEEYMAKHFAKHLVNRELGKSGEQNKIAQMSPKYPEQAPQFMELYNKAVIVSPEEEQKTEEEVRLDVINKNMSAPKKLGRPAKVKAAVKEFEDAE